MSVNQKSSPQSQLSVESGFVSLSHEAEIFNIMKICDNIMFPHIFVRRMVAAEGIKNRACAIEWMMKVKKILLCEITVDL